jgi:AbrB family looped-hinge helix DNA binding protein
MANNLTSTGPVTIPKKVRERLGIEAGSAVAFELTDAGEVVLRAVARSGGRRPARAPTSRFAKLRGRATVKMRTEEILALTRGR